MLDAEYQRNPSALTDKRSTSTRNSTPRSTIRFIKSLSVRLKKSRSIYEQFFCLVKRLSRFFTLSRAVLVVHSSHQDVLKVIAIKGVRLTRQGLALTLPEKDSLLYSVFREKRMYSEDFSSLFKGNFIERKLLLDKDTGSFAVCPIECDGSTRGLLCLTSPFPYTFSIFEEGLLNGVMERFGRLIEKEMQRLSI